MISGVQWLVSQEKSVKKGHSAVKFEALFGDGPFHPKKGTPETMSMTLPVRYDHSNEKSKERLEAVGPFSSLASDLRNYQV